MAKKEKEPVIEKVTEEPKIDETVEKLKIKKPKIKKFQEPEDNIIKVDLNKPPKTKEDADTEQKTADVVTDKQTEVIQEVVEETSQEQTPVQNEDTPVIEEITNEQSEIEKITKVVEKEIIESIETDKKLPENVQKLMNFIEDTGGDLNDYVNLNKDYSEMDNHTLLREYYRTTKPHLQGDEIDFLMEDQFSFDEEVDEERDIKRKKLALKEQVANAKTQLEEHKSKYYEDIKAGSKLTQEQQKAIDFFNRYNKESEDNQKAADKAKSTFLKKTDNVFNNKFKGFEYNVGEKKFRFNVKDANQTKETQADINNFVKKFLNEKNEMSDAKGYHKGLFTAMNADAIANHFYEQGKTDAMKDSVAKAKNVNMDPRQSHGEIEAGGIKVRVLGEDSSDFKFKIKQK